MAFKVQSEPFTSGQFVGMWMYGQVMWSDAYKVIDGVVHTYSSDIDEWRGDKVLANYKELGTVFIQYEEE